MIRLASIILNENRPLGKSIKDEGWIYKYVQVFRAMLASEGTNIKSKDFVTTSKKFAIEHANHMTSVHGELYHVVAFIVLASDVYKAFENPGEYFYEGATPKAAQVIYKADDYL